MNDREKRRGYLRKGRNSLRLSIRRWAVKDGTRRWICTKLGREMGAWVVVK
jgi:hypothetical protein